MEHERDTGAEPPKEPADVPADTSTDWDEWMERHGNRPRPRADIADDKGRFPDPVEDGIPRDPSSQR